MSEKQMSITKQMALKIQGITGDSLIRINAQADQYIQMGFAKDRITALNLIYEQLLDEEMK